MDHQEIKKSVVSILKELYPGEKVYGTDMGSGLSKPCLAVTMSVHLIGGNVNVKRKGCRIEVIRMQGQPDEADALDFYRKMEDRFFPGFHVGDRFLDTEDFDAGFMGDGLDVPMVEIYTEYYEKAGKPGKAGRMMEEIILKRR